MGEWKKAGCIIIRKVQKMRQKSKLDVSQFSENVKTISSKYRLGPSGYFGEKGKNHRIIRVMHQCRLQLIFIKISKGGYRISFAKWRKECKLFLAMGHVLYIA